MTAPRRILRLGFVPLTDCAPLVMAQELGLFQKHGLRVSLSRELGWATVRDKIIYGELDAAHALAAMPVAATLGLGSIACDCLTALVLNLHGNAITLSNDLWQRGVRDGNTLREEIQRARREQIYTFGAVYSFSSHRHLLRQWFIAHGINPERDARIVIVPPPQMVKNLEAGHLDGFCVGEPWNSVAVQSRAGWIAATSAELDPGHPEKVLMVRRDFTERRAGEHVALVAALLEACEFCDAPENHGQIISTLARPEYVGVSETALRHGINGELDFGHGVSRRVGDFCFFHGNDANEPSSDKAAWAFELMRASGLCKESSTLNFAFGRHVFRMDIYEAAIRLRATIAAKAATNSRKWNSKSTAPRVPKSKLLFPAFSGAS
ncbi:MAG: ABC transporter substrate-binding protein [Verrucomicrobia bacterium]|nr:ABC transporter substrate-binding protein [Verrucomicrobiota bacterium]MDE3099872.1 ABC transporter substrate-binding protein [Verrucomicrobiota bacterium]